MKAVKVMATINEQGQLMLDQPLSIEKDSRVEVIVLISESDEDKGNQIPEIGSEVQGANP